MGDGMGDMIPSTPAADGRRDEREPVDYGDRIARAVAVLLVAMQGAGVVLVGAAIAIGSVALGAAIGSSIYGLQRTIYETGSVLDAVGDDGDEVEAAGVGPGFVDSFNVLCRRPAATKIQASCGQISYSAEVDSAATGTAYFGDSAVTTSAYGASRTAGKEIGGNVRYEYCVANEDAGVTIHVRSMCASEQ